MWDQSLLTKSWGLKLISLLWVELLSLGKKVLFWLCWVGTSADLSQGKIPPPNHLLEGLGMKGEDPWGEGIFPYSPQWGRECPFAKILLVSLRHCEYINCEQFPSWHTPWEVWTCHPQLRIPLWKPGSFMPQPVLLPRALNSWIYPSYEMQGWCPAL